MIRKAIILAAGRGERMGAHTVSLPKPLLPIRGKPLMEFVVDLLVAHGVEEIGVNLNYRGEEIATYFGSGSRYGTTFQYVRESELTGTAGGVRSVAKALALQEPFFVVSADMLVNFDLSALASEHARCGGIGTLSCYFRPRDQLKKSGVILFDERTKEIQRFVERPQSDEEIVSQWVNSSVYAFSPALLDIIPEAVGGSAVVDLPKHVFPLAIKQRGLFACPFNSETFYQLGIDTPDRIGRAENDLESGLFVPTHKPN